MTKVRAKNGAPVKVDDLGKHAVSIPVTIGPRFLELFSSNLYTSPNKAFEELISNCWDAKATVAYVGISPDLGGEDAALWVLDNGLSMNHDGLAQLWTVGDSTKRDHEDLERPPIGKFGIGKLATYLLANRLTYVCKARDGIVRLVEMDYERIAQQASGGKRTLLRADTDRAINLDVRELSEKDLRELFARLGATGQEVSRLIKSGFKVPPHYPSPYADEFGGEPHAPITPSKGTWTLALMLSLKTNGRRIQRGRLQRMLEAALPLGDSMTVVYCGDVLHPKLEQLAVLAGSSIGPDLDIDVVTQRVDASPEQFNNHPQVNPLGGVKREARGQLFYDYPVHKFTHPYSHIRLGDIPGHISGRWTLFEDELTERKADELGRRSHGYFVNVRGRVLNTDAPYFGLENLNHTAWARFRACVRADWLDEALTVNRESLNNEITSVDVFRLFLRALFNKSRAAFDAPTDVPQLREAGKQLTDAWGALPLQALRNAVSELAKTPDKLPREIHVTSSDVRGELRNWLADAKKDPASLLKEVVHRGMGRTAPLFLYDLGERSIIVNLDHPTAIEYGASRDAKELLGLSAVAEVLSDAQLTVLGLSAEDVSDFQNYRDYVRRAVVQLSRRSAANIASELIDSASNWRRLEDAVVEALQALGFTAAKIAKTGRTDGLAKSPVPSSRARPDRGYVFTFDAKASANGRVKTSDIKAEKLRLHREDESADYTLVVAPDFEAGQIERVCRNAECTPMRASTLAKLLMLAARVGSLDLGELEVVFDRHDPDAVDRFVDDMIKRHIRSRRPSLEQLLSVLGPEHFGKGKPVSAKVLTDRLQREQIIPETTGAKDIMALFSGFAFLVPWTLRVTPPDTIQFANSPEMLIKAIAQAVGPLPEEYRMGLDAALTEPRVRSRRATATRKSRKKRAS